MDKKWIGLVDCNNFFASCERLFRPDLAGKPVAVLSSNDGCIVARSQEIKDIGVPMGVPYFKIKDTLKKHGATTFSSHFALYRDVSRRVMAVLRDELDEVEQYSVDEAFFSVSGELEVVAKRVKAAVERQVGIPVSVGIARTKTQAKYANSLAKKGSGVYVMTEADWQSRTPDTPLSAIWGVGGALELRYKENNLQTVADLLAVDTDRIGRIFGLPGVRLQRELRGEPVFHLEHTLAPQQSIISSRSFKKTTTELAVLADAVAYHVRHAASDLRKMGLGATKIHVSIRPSRHGDFMLRGGSAEAVLPKPTDDSFVLLQEAQSLLTKVYERDVPYQKAGVVLGDLQSLEVQQEALFVDPAKRKNERVMAVMDQLNQRVDRELVTLGSRLRTADWQARHEVRSPAYTTRWSDVATVKAG